MKNLDYIFDGAMGTYYSSLYGDNSSEYANFKNPQRVIDIHKEYMKAGATAIKTNTFGYNRFWSVDGFNKEAMIKEGIKLAFRAAENTDVKVFGDIGPSVCDDENNEYLDIVKLFAAEGITHFLFETLFNLNGVEKAVQYIRSHVKDGVVIVSFACNQEGYTGQGFYYLPLLQEAKTFSDYVGLNCVCGPNHIFKLVQKIPKELFPLSVMPNSGYPEIINDEPVYQENQDYYSDMLVKIAGLDVSVVGGCCGTTPEHIKEFTEKLEKGELKNVQLPKTDQKETQGETFNFHSIINEKYKNNKKVIAVELSPPNTCDCSFLMESGKKIKEAGADLITLVDSPLARTRADSMMISAKVKREIGIETVPHLSCRDRNQIAIKGSLIAGNIEGISNILAITGDTIAKLDREDAKGVFCFNSINLINLIRQLNSELFRERPYFIASALNINAINFKSELNRAIKKIDMGSQCMFTQAVFTDEAVENLILAKEKLNVPILVGLLPVAGYKNALFLHNEVSGITLPESFLKELEGTSAENIRTVSTSFVKSIIDKTEKHCHGYYISTPLKKVDFVCDIVEYIKKLD